MLDKVRADYPSTEAATYAGLRRAQALMFAHSYDAAIAEATQVVTANPGKIIACWAQCTLGQSLVCKGQTADGVRELWKVPGMLPDQTDLGPVNEAREVLGRVCEQYLVEREDDLDAAQTVGLNASDAGDKAMLLAILAAYRARGGSFAEARETLSRLSTECAAQADELGWANAEVAMYCLDRLAHPDEQAQDAADTLHGLCASLPSGHQSGARACLSLARHYKRSGDKGKWLAALEMASAKFGGSANGAEILEQLGRALHVHCRTAEACATLAQVKARYPHSGYVAPALYAIGNYSVANRTAALDALRQLAEGQYDRSWRGLAHWKLGDLHRCDDKARALVHYRQALDLFRQRLEHDVADQGDWRIMLGARVALIESRIASLGGDTR